MPKDEGPFKKGTDRPLTVDEAAQFAEDLERQELEELREWVTRAERVMLQQAEEIRILREELENALELLETLAAR